MTLMMLSQPTPGLANSLVVPPVRLARPRVMRRPRTAWPVFAGPIVARTDSTAILPTHPIHNAMRRGMLTFSTDHDELVKLRVDGKVRLVRVRTGFAPTRPATPPRDANLLKTHLDLVDRAARREGGFGYDLPDALGRLGYKRLEGGQFHPATVRALAERLAVLAAMRVSLEGAGEEDLTSEPCWRLWVPGGAGDAPRPLEEGDIVEALRQAGGVWIAPGRWFGAIELARYQAQLDRRLLGLPMDGNGNEVQRLALLLAAELAVWERAEKRRGARTIARSIGSLLEKAMAAHKPDLIADAARRLNTPKRLRAYLAGEGFADEGALALLRELGGFDVDIKDEAAFWAAGRGWVERFWGARLAIGVGDRPLASLPAAAGEGTNSHRRV